MKIEGIGSARELSDEEYVQRIKIYAELSGRYKSYLASTLGMRAVRDLEKQTKDLQSRDFCTDLSLINYKRLTEAIMTAFCDNKTHASAKFTPECYKKNWSDEKLNALVNCEIPHYKDSALAFFGSISC